jgi:hypothetical protein
MSSVVSDFDMAEFFGENEITEQDAQVVVELRSQLSKYISAKELKTQGDKAMAESKAEIQRLFDELPEELKVTQNQKPKEVAGQIFTRVKKVITIDGWNLVFNEKVNTSSPRDTFIKEITERASKQADNPAARLAYLDALKVFESHLAPKIGSEFKIEPVAEKTK